MSDFFPYVAKNVAYDISLLDAGQEVPDHEIQINAKIYLVSVRGHRDAVGRVLGVSVALTNINKQKELERQLSASIRELETFAWTDGLTSLSNRRFFDLTLQKEMGRKMRDGLSLALLIIDVDYFKSYNDRYGHPAGDRCLQSIAESIRFSLRRPGDLSSRIGGEEFVVILPGTGLDGARTVAIAIQEKIASLALEHETSPFAQVTVSIGISHLPEDRFMDEGAGCVMLFTTADRALYIAKSAGRNAIHESEEV